MLRPLLPTRSTSPARIIAVSPGSTTLGHALLLAEAGPAGGFESSALVATSVERVWTKLESHFKQLIGDAGIRAVLDRTVMITSARVAWLVPPPPGVVGGAAYLRSLLEQQAPDAGVAAGAELLTEFVALLGRFIGDALVRRLLHELWPDAVALVSKELS